MRTRQTLWNRSYKNKAENAFAQLASQSGWLFTKRGFPDFACFKDGKLILVEVKPSKVCKLKRAQSLLFQHLKAHGITCITWSPDSNIDPFEE